MQLLKEVGLSPKCNQEWPNIIDKSVASRSTIRRTDCMPFRESGMVILAEVHASQHSTLSDTIKSIIADQNVSEAYFCNLHNNAAIGFIVTKNSPACRAVKGELAFCKNCLLNAQRNDDGEVEWKIILEETALESLTAKLKASGMPVKIDYLRDLQGNGHLTARQDEVLKSAFEKGYFEYPKRNNMIELAQAFGISVPALAETLRTAEKKIVKEHYTR